MRQYTEKQLIKDIIVTSFMMILTLFIIFGSFFLVLHNKENTNLDIDTACHGGYLFYTYPEGPDVQIISDFGNGVKCLENKQ